METAAELHRRAPAAARTVALVCCGLTAIAAMIAVGAGVAMMSEGLTSSDKFAGVGLIVGAGIALSGVAVCAPASIAWILLLKHHPAGYAAAIVTGTCLIAVATLVSVAGLAAAGSGTVTVMLVVGALLCLVAALPGR